MFKFYKYFNEIKELRSEQEIFDYFKNKGIILDKDNLFKLKDYLILKNKDKTNNSTLTFKQLKNVTGGGMDFIIMENHLTVKYTPKHNKVVIKHTDSCCPREQHITTEQISAILSDKISPDPLSLINLGMGARATARAHYITPENEEIILTHYDLKPYIGEGYKAISPISPTGVITIARDGYNPINLHCKIETLPYGLKYCYGDNPGEFVVERAGGISHKAHKDAAGNVHYFDHVLQKNEGTYRDFTVRITAETSDPNKKIKICNETDKLGHYFAINHDGRFCEAIMDAAGNFHYSDHDSSYVIIQDKEKHIVSRVEALTDTGSKICEISDKPGYKTVVTANGDIFETSIDAAGNFHYLDHVIILEKGQFKDYKETISDSGGKVFSLISNPENCLFLTKHGQIYTAQIMDDFDNVLVYDDGKIHLLVLNNDTYIDATIEFTDLYGNMILSSDSKVKFGLSPDGWFDEIECLGNYYFYTYDGIRYLLSSVEDLNILNLQVIEEPEELSGLPKHDDIVYVYDKDGRKSIVTPNGDLMLIEIINNGFLLLKDRAGSHIILTDDGKFHEAIQNKWGFHYIDDKSICHVLIKDNTSYISAIFEVQFGEGNLLVHHENNSSNKILLTSTGAKYNLEKSESYYFYNTGIEKHLLTCDEDLNILDLIVIENPESLGLPRHDNIVYVYDSKSIINILMLDYNDIMLIEFIKSGYMQLKDKNVNHFILTDDGNLLEFNSIYNGGEYKLLKSKSNSTWYIFTPDENYYELIQSEDFNYYYYLKNKEVHIVLINDDGILDLPPIENSKELGLPYRDDIAYLGDLENLYVATKEGHLEAACKDNNGNVYCNYFTIFADGTIASVEFSYQNGYTQFKDEFGRNFIMTLNGNYYELQLHKDFNFLYYEDNDGLNHMLLFTDDNNYINAIFTELENGDNSLFIEFNGEKHNVIFIGKDFIILNNGECMNFVLIKDEDLEDLLGDDLESGASLKSLEESKRTRSTSVDSFF